jgi:hypothetical protein
MLSELLPPEGTKDEMVFLIAHEKSPKGFLWMWHEDGWWRRTGERYRYSPRTLAREGWFFLADDGLVK